MVFLYFCEWASRKRKELEEQGIEAVLTTVNYGKEEQSARLDLNNHKRLGRIALSAEGHCDLELMDQGTGENKSYEYRHFDKESRPNFDAEFLDFLKSFE